MKSATALTYSFRPTYITLNMAQSADLKWPLTARRFLLFSQMQARDEEIGDPDVGIKMVCVLGALVLIAMC